MSTRVTLKQRDPQRYAQICREQDRLKEAYSSSVQVARLCPFCGHKIEILCRGPYSGTYTKCPGCGEDVFFPPISFRLG